MTNEELVAKGIITAEALAAAGKLNPRQADKFIDYVIDESSLKNYARIERFDEESATIEKIGVGRRVAMAAKVATDPGKRRGVSTSKITLSPKEIIVPFEIGDNFKQFNIEGATIEDHVIKMMATQLANDMEELQILGDSLGQAVLESDIEVDGSTTQYVKDEYMALFNGWWRQADDAHVVDAQDEDISSNLFSRMIKAMPHKFKRNRANMYFATPDDIEQNYREKVATRQTASGDIALSSTLNLKPFGVELTPVALLPLNPKIVEHVVMNTDGTTATPLRYQPISNVVVTIVDITFQTPIDAYIEDTDYSVDYVNGTVTRLGGGSIPSGGTVKVTYTPGPQLLLTLKNNLIIAIGRDIRIERDRDIYRRLNQFCITAKIDAVIEEVDSVVKAINVGEN